jgi:VWFA-related protein
MMPQAVRNRSSRALIPLAFLLFTPLPAAPQTFEESSQVTAVEVPVNVVDREGNPVRGLSAANFEIYDGGDLQKITSFEMVDLAALDQGPEPAVELASGARRHFLLMFDLSFASPTSILKARMAARDFVLSSLHPTDLAAVATFSLEYGPKLVITFTPDRAQLARAIDTLGARRVTDARRSDPLRFLIETPMGDEGTLTTGPGSAVDFRAQKDQAVLEYLQTLSSMADRSERTFEVGRISSYSRALGDVAKRLNAVKGRKHVLFFSEGFDSRLLLGRETTDIESETDNQNIANGRSFMVDNDARYGNTGLQNDVNKMLEEFRRADCVIQAVDVGGLRAIGDQRPRASGQEALFYMANETGGELFKDANNLREPLERVLERTSVTYLLTFERSDLKTDGSYHKLRVKLKDLPASTRVTHRTGYYAPRPFQDLDPLEKSLLASDGIASATPRRDLDMNVLVAAFRANEQTAYVPVIIEVKGPSLLAGHKGEKLDVEFFAYVSDNKNQMRGFFTQRVSFEMAKAKKALEETGVKYYGHFELPPGEYRVRVLTRNSQTGRAAVDSVPLEVPSYEAAQPILLPPFFIEENQRWIMVRERTEDDEPRTRTSVVYPFTVSGEPYVPAAKPRLKRHERARLCVVAYNLGKGDVSLSGKVFSADGKDSSAGSFAMVERTATGIEGLDKLTATFDPGGLNAGDYVLQVAVVDPKTGHRETNSLPFHVLH